MPHPPTCRCGSGLPPVQCCASGDGFRISPAAYSRARRRLQRLLREFLTSHREELARGEIAYFGRPLGQVRGVSLDEMDDFLDHLAHDPGPTGSVPSLIRRFAEQARDDLSVGERVALDEMLDSFPAFVELNTLSESGLAELQDALTGRRFQAVGLTHGLPQEGGWLLFGRFTRWRGQWRAGDTLHLVSPSCRTRLLAELDSERRRASGDGALTAWPEFLETRTLGLPDRLWRAELQRLRELVLSGDLSVYRQQGTGIAAGALVNSLAERREADLDEVTGGPADIREYRFRILAIDRFALLDPGAPATDPLLATALGARTPDAGPLLGYLSVNPQESLVSLETWSESALDALRALVDDMAREGATPDVRWEPRRQAGLAALAARVLGRIQSKGHSRSA